MLNANFDSIEKLHYLYLLLNVEDIDLSRLWYSTHFHHRNIYFCVSQMGCYDGLYKCCVELNGHISIDRFYEWNGWIDLKIISSLKLKHTAIDNFLGSWQQMGKSGLRPPHVAMKY